MQLNCQSTSVQRTLCVCVLLENSAVIRNYCKLLTHRPTSQPTHCSLCIYQLPTGHWLLASLATMYVCMLACRRTQQRATWCGMKFIFFHFSFMLLNFIYKYLLAQALTSLSLCLRRPRSFDLIIKCRANRNNKFHFLTFNYFFIL